MKPGCAVAVVLVTAASMEYIGRYYPDYTLLAIVVWVILYIAGCMFAELRRLRPVPEEPVPDLVSVRRRDEAERLAKEMLVRLLTPEQKFQYATTGQFKVPLPDGQYAMLGDGWVIWSVGRQQCVHPTRQHERTRIILPATDSVIAQLLWLRNDPDSLYKVK